MSYPYAVSSDFIKDSAVRSVQKYYVANLMQPLIECAHE